VFRFLLKVEDGEPNDPALFMTAVPDWIEGREFLLGGYERLRILAINSAISDELKERGINAVFTVERAYPRAARSNYSSA
jgi:hypothetical protein